VNGTVILVFLLWMLFKIPAVQNALADWMADYLSEELDCRVEIGTVDIQLFNEAHFEDFYVEDQHGDTLLFARRLDAYLDLSALVHRRLIVEEVHLAKGQFYYHRPKGERQYNLQFILYYLAGNKKKKKKKRKPPIALDIRKVQLDSIDFHMLDEIAGSSVKVFAPNGRLYAQNSDLITQLVDCDSLFLDSAKVAIRIFEGSPMPADPNPNDSSTYVQPKWTVYADKLRFNHFEFSLLNERLGVRPELPLDFSDLQIDPANFFLDDLSLRNDSLQAQVLQLSAKEARGFQLDSLRGELMVCPTGSHLKNFKLQTPNSVLGHELIFHYPEFPAFYDFVHQVDMRAKGRNAVVLFRDVMTFAPTLYKIPLFEQNKGRWIRGDFDFEGPVEHFFVRNANLDIEQTHFEGQLEFKPFEQYMRMEPADLQTHTDDIFSIFSFLSLPKQMQALAAMSFQGSYEGNFNGAFVANGQLMSTLGQLNAALKMDLSRGLERASYDGELQFKNFNLGKLINLDELSSLDADFNLKGSGTSLNSMDAKINKANINRMVYKEYPYDTIRVEGMLEPYAFAGLLASQDPNFDLDLYCSANLKDSLPKIELFGQIQLIDFYKTKLLKDTFRLGIERIKIQTEGNKLDNFSGDISLEDIGVDRSWGQYYLPEIKLQAGDSLLLGEDSLGQERIDSSRYLRFRSNFGQVDLLGNYDEVNLPKSLYAFVQNNYPNYLRNFNLAQAKDSIALQELRDSMVVDSSLFSLPDQEVHLSVWVNDSNHLLQLLHPNLEALEGLSLQLDYDSPADSFYLNGELGRFRWAGFEMRENNLFARGRDSSFEIQTGLEYMQLNDTAKLPTPKVRLRGKGDTIDYNIQLREVAKLASDVELNGRLTFEEKALQSSLNNSGLTLLDRSWQVDGSNYIRFDFGQQTLDVSNLVLQDSAAYQRLAVESYGNKGLKANLAHIDVAWLYDLVRINLFDLAGELDAEIRIKDVFKQKGLLADFDFRKFHVNGDNWENLHLRIGSDNLKSPLTGYLEHAGPLVDSINADFSFLPAFATEDEEKKNDLEVNFALKNAKGRILEYFMAGIVENTTGLASARGKITQEKGNLTLSGVADIEDLATSVIFLNSRYRMPKGRLLLGNKGLYFAPRLKILGRDADCASCLPIRISEAAVYYISGGVPIIDQEGNTGYLGGGITHQKLNKWGIDMDIVFDNNLSLNTGPGSDMPFYGKVYGTGIASFSGLFTNMSLKVEAATNKGRNNEKSKLFLPLMDPVEITQAVDFLTFVDKKAQANPDSLEEQEEKAVSSSGGIDIEMDIHATPDGIARIIIDEKAGDIIEGRGEGDLQIRYSRTGELDLRGLYTITAGDYLFTYRNLINKKFEVEKGGTIRWSGDPYNADINMKAKYKQSSRLYNLLLSYQEELQNATIRSAANKPVDVQVNMYMTGSLMKPDIKFGLELNETVEGRVGTLAKLALRAIQQDENKLNRQVFGLIALNQFLPEENSGANVNLAASSFNTLSELVTQQFSRQINSLLSEVVEDVDVISSVDFDFDYRLQENQLDNNSTAGSQLNVQLDQYYFKDKLRVSIGTNVDFNNEQNLNGSNSNYIGGDFMVEYSVSKSGNLKVRVYNRSETSLFGPRVRTGVGLSYNREFDSFEQLFQEIKSNIQKKTAARKAKKKKKKAQEDRMLGPS